MWKQIQKRTLFFVVFLVFFLILLLSLTYYSRVAYFEGLPLVETVMPERTEEFKNGRYLYVIPQQAVQQEENTGKLFIYTARNYKDVLGERNLVTRILIRVEQQLEDEMVLIDGIVREEPVIIEGIEMFCDGQSVLLKETD